jgi:hypothetical protein
MGLAIAVLALFGVLGQEAAKERPYIWTPKLGPEPKLTGPGVLGFRPAHAISYRVTATGRGVIKYTAERLPPGVTLDPVTGVLSGSVGFPGQFRFRLTATSREGKDTRDMRLVVEDQVALTPPIGVWVDTPEAVQSLNERLAPSGWTLAIAKAGDTATAAAIEQARLRLGLRLGNARPETAAYLAFEGGDVGRLDTELRKRRVAPILHSYAVPPLEQAADIPAPLHVWRVGTPEPTWDSISKAFTLDPWVPYVRPGRFIDPGPLYVGALGLTPSEQVTQVTLWSLLAAPLILATDPRQLDGFGLSLLTNSEVLAINQDPTGKAARLTFAAGDFEVWSKLLEDQTLAIGVFNKGNGEAKCTLDFLDPSVRKVEVRDVWRQEKVRMKANILPLEVRAHGAMLFRTNKNVEFRFRVGHDPKPPRKKDGGG